MNKVELFNKIINEFNDKKILNDLILLAFIIPHISC